MSEQVKRYDAVHIRYEDNNIRYGEGCEVEVVTAADYEREVRIAIAAGQRMQDKRDALHAEADALRVALLEIASANPAERGIEWAKSYASDGLKGAGSELYARWLETFKEAEALRAENGRLRADLALAMKVPSVAAMHSFLEKECAQQNMQLGKELEAARGLLRVNRERMSTISAHSMTMPADWCSNFKAEIRSGVQQIDAFLTATTSPDVPDHFAEASKMV